MTYEETFLKDFEEWLNTQVMVNEGDQARPAEAGKDLARKAPAQLAPRQGCVQARRGDAYRKRNSPQGVRRQGRRVLRACGMRNDKGNLALTGRVPLVVFCIKASKFK